MLKTILMLAALAAPIAPMFAQATLSLSSSSTAMKPGDVGLLTTSLVLDGRTISMLQYDLQLSNSAGVQVGAATISQNMLAFGKSAQCNMVLFRCGLFGIDTTTVPPALNSTLIAGGVVGTQVLALQNTVPAANLVFTLTHVIGVDATGTPVALTAGPPLTIVVSAPSPPVNPFDVDGNGVVDAKDVQAAIDQTLGRVPCTTGDVDKIGGCTLTDVQLVIKATGH